jgi:hypothetical protein
VFEESRSSTKRHKALTHDSLRNPERNALKSTNRVTNENSMKRLQKTEKEKREEQQEHLRNHAKPSIHTMKDSYKV